MVTDDGHPLLGTAPMGLEEASTGSVTIAIAGTRLDNRYYPRSSTTASIATSAPLGKAATPMQQRAGKGSSNQVA